MWIPAGEPERIPLPLEISKHVRVARIPIRLSQLDAEVPDISNVILVNPSEAATFATAKRAEEHASGRWLLGAILTEMYPTVDLSNLDIIRDENRAPRIKWLEGTFRGDPLPSFSISTSHSSAFVAISLTDQVVGIDAEPLDTPRSANLPTLMAANDEAALLERAFESQGSNIINRVWTAKEAILKALRTGMSLSPIRVEVLGGNEQILSQIEVDGSEIKLWNFDVECYEKYTISIALRHRSPSETPQPDERELKFLERIHLGEIGC